MKWVYQGVVDRVGEYQPHDTAPSIRVRFSDRRVLTFWGGPGSKRKKNLDMIEMAKDEWGNKGWTIQVEKFADKNPTWVPEYAKIKCFRQTSEDLITLQEPHTNGQIQLPEEEEAIFLPGPNIWPTLLHILRTAQNEIRIASPWITNPDELEAILKEKHSAGVRIRGLVLSDQKSEGIQRLRRAGLAFYDLEDLHIKMVLVDQHWLYIGSANLTQAARQRNREGGVIFGQKHLIQAAQNYFDELYEEAI